MKKIRLFSLLALAPLLAAGACGGAPAALAFQSNWYRNPRIGDNIENTLEELEYEVSFLSTPQNGFSAAYSGTYRTVLKNQTLSLDSSQKEGYVLTGDLQMDVTFTLNGVTGETKHNFVASRVEFLSVGDRLSPVRSQKEVLYDAPMGAPSSLEDCSHEYHYTYGVEYDDALTQAATTYSDLNPASNGTTPEPVRKELKIGSGATFLDNEEILFAMRGLDLSASLTFRSIHFELGSVESIRLESVTATNVPVSFEADGELVDTSLAALSVSMRYAGKYGGQAQTLVYAKKESDTSNPYRNVLLSMEVPALQSLGTWRYTLKKAAFTAK